MSARAFTGQPKVQRVTPSRAEQRKLDANWAAHQATWKRLAKPPKEHESAVAIDSRCHSVIRAAVQRNGLEMVHDDTPLSELVARANADPVADSEMAVRQEHFNAFLNWVFGDSPHPAMALRRLYALAYHRRPDLLAHMPMADLGLLLGETRAAFSFRLKQLFPGIPCRTQKRAGSRDNYSKAQRGNRNRRKGERRKQRQAEEIKNYEHN